MGINQLRAHEKIISIFRENFDQNVFRVDDEGYEYVDEKYSSLYDSLMFKFLEAEIFI